MAKNIFDGINGSIESTFTNYFSCDMKRFDYKSAAKDTATDFIFLFLCNIWVYESLTIANTLFEGSTAYIWMAGTQKSIIATIATLSSTNFAIFCSFLIITTFLAASYIKEHSNKNILEKRETISQPSSRLKKRTPEQKYRRRTLNTGIKSRKRFHRN